MTAESPPLAVVAVADPEVREMLSRTVAGAGLGPVLVHDGREVVRRLEHLHPELILLDVQLPGLSGIEVCWWIRRQRHLVRVPVVLLGARNSPFEIDAGLLAGANHHVATPFTGEQIRAVVDRFRTARPGPGPTLPPPTAVVIPDLGLAR